MAEALIETRGLTKHFLTGKKGIIDTLARTRIPVVKAVEKVDLAIGEGEVMALVGESGSGKTTLGRLMVTLERATSGELYHKGQKVEGRAAVKELRNNVQMVFQNPIESLDPRMSIESIVTEPLSRKGLDRQEKKTRFEVALQRVGLDAATFAQRRPQDLSGGQRQRVAVARAVIPDPQFIVLDEPTSALDASVQSQVLNLLAILREELRLTYLLITHNIAIARYISDRVAVMYAGEIVEIGPTEDVLTAPKHPYTQALFSSVPSLENKEIVPPTGEVPSLINLPTGCKFHPRCPFVMEVCKTTDPGLRKVDNEEVACWLYK
ncbi:MAG: ABC transporter ATP-binding protein [Nitrososphaerales archaeon]|jgi:peptide/nickel transport system ATP-binding protein